MFISACSLTRQKQGFIYRCSKFRKYGQSRYDSNGHSDSTGQSIIGKDSIGHAMIGKDTNSTGHADYGRSFELYSTLDRSRQTTPQIFTILSHIPMEPRGCGDVLIGMGLSLPDILAIHGT